MKSPSFFLVLALFFGEAGAAPGDESSRAAAPAAVTALAAPMAWPAKTMQEHFASPPVEFWPGTVWWWPGGAVTREGVAKELQLMKDAGIGIAGVVTMGYKTPSRPEVPGHTAAPAGSPEWARHVAEAVEDAARIGIRVDFTPTTSWPLSGSWVTDDLAAQILIQARQPVHGGNAFSGSLPLPGRGSVKGQTWAEYVKGYRIAFDREPTLHLEALVLVNAKGETRAVTSGIAPDGCSAAFEVPPGEWELAAFWRCASKHFGPRTRVIDHMSAQAVRRQMEEIARPVLDLLPRELIGTALPGITLDNIEGFSEAWTTGFLQQFEQSKGYDLRPWLPLLFPEEGQAGDLRAARRGQYARIAYDYDDVKAEFYREGCFATMRRWANENGLSLMAEGHQPASGDHIDTNGAADIPELEIYKAKPANDRGFGTMRSAGHLYGRNVLGAEAYTWQTPHFRGTLQDLREASDEMFALGGNRINHHGWAYSPDGAGWPGWLFYASSNINHRNSWFPLLRGLTDYTARTSMVLRAGRPVVDVAFYGGNEPDLKRVGIDDPARLYDRVSKQALLTRAEIRDSRIAMGFGQYTLLLLCPENKTIPLEVLQKIKSLVLAGGNVATLARPEAIPGFKDYEAKETELRSLVAQLFPERRGLEPRKVGKGRTWWIGAQDLAAVLAQTGISPQVAGPVPLAFEHRQGKDFDTFFVFNAAQEAVQGTFDFRATGRPELWDAKTGALHTVPSETHGGRRTLSLELAPRTGRLIVFRSDDVPPAPPLPSGRLVDVAGVDGTWEVEFLHADGRPPFSRSFPQLADWLSHDELRYFSGEGIYRKTFRMPQTEGKGQLLLDLGEVKQAARVELNGRDLGILIEAPYRVEIPSGLLRPGDNRLTVRVCNLMENAIVPLLPKPGPGNEKWQGSFIKPEDLRIIGKTHSGGLIGPVRVLRYPGDGG